MSWHTVKDEGIILRMTPFRESDRLYTVLTRAHGKVVMVGRGAQKPKAKLAPFLDPLRVLYVEWVEGRHSTTIISVDTKERFVRIEQDDIARNLAHIVGHALDKHAHEHDVHEDLYILLASWLRELNQETIDSYTRRVFMLGGFFLQFLRHMGYQTQLQHCFVCTESIVPFSFRWHGGKGGLICSDCLQKNEQERHGSILLNEYVLRMLRFTEHMSFADFRNMHLSGNYVAEFIRVVDDLMKYHLPDSKERSFWSFVLEDMPLATIATIR